jgi:hypothetical protein
MKKSMNILAVLLIALPLLHGCGGEAGDGEESSGRKKKSSRNFDEGKDYVIFERVRLLDEKGFTEPQEAYSLLLPKGWKHEDEVDWQGPGSNCAGTYHWLKARSADKKYRFEIYPDVSYTWTTNQQLQDFNRNNSTNSSYCSFREPMDAEEYLRQVFAPEELGDPEIISVEPNRAVIRQMEQMNEKTAQELNQYGAGNIEFRQTAVNANVRWSNGTEGWVVLGVTIMEMQVPNVYNGSVERSYTTAISKRTVFRYPSGSKDMAKDQFSVIMGSIRTNPAWDKAVAGFWRDVRQQRHVANVGKIRMMDEQTRRMGEETIRRGNERLRDMDVEMRNWEARQSSQDRMHTSFIKTIREVEHYQDETGKVELASGYDHAWSRNGQSFILSNNPNFDPAFVLKDNNWKEMKKVDE